MTNLEEIIIMLSAFKYCGHDLTSMAETFYFNLVSRLSEGISKEELFSMVDVIDYNIAALANLEGKESFCTRVFNIAVELQLPL